MFQLWKFYTFQKVDEIEFYFFLNFRVLAPCLLLTTYQQTILFFCTKYKVIFKTLFHLNSKAYEYLILERGITHMFVAVVAVSFHCHSHSLIVSSLDFMESFQKPSLWTVNHINAWEVLNLVLMLHTWCWWCFYYLLLLLCCCCYNIFPYCCCWLKLFLFLFWQTLILVSSWQLVVMGNNCGYLEGMTNSN